MLEIEVLKDVSALAERAANLFQTAAQEAISANGKFSVALAGGSTPLRMYDLLACDPFKLKIDWSKCHLFWGDERCVPPVHPDSNYLQSAAHLISKVDIPVKNIHRIQGELSPIQAATEYQSELQRYFGSYPVFDLILLGLGPDGHTASLFPGTQALEEKGSWVVAVPHSTPPSPLVDRVSLTLPVINAARQVLFLVAGADKAEIVARVFKTPGDEPLLPAQRVSPGAGRLTWLLDVAAMGKLDRV